MIKRILVAVVLTLMPTLVLAGDAPTLHLQSLFYGDNTEFLRNPYRDGETLLGVSNRLFIGLPLSTRAAVELGVFTDHRAGGSKAFELVRPIARLRVGSPNNQFIMGTLDHGLFSSSSSSPGPDEAGPHHLIPALEVETLSFSRGYEAGIQWLHKGRLTQDTWMSWQKLNTPAHRERFDTGLTTRFEVAGGVAIGAQAHITHEGGQLYHAGVVRDDIAGAVGVIYKPTWIAVVDSCNVEAFWLVSKHVPDRSHQATTVRGRGLFLRSSVARAYWRLTYIGWRGKRFIHDEGDPNYGAVLNDGQAGITFARRTYTEVSLSRSFRIAQSARLDLAFRQYWVDGEPDYSYRVLTVLDLSHRLRRAK